MRHPFRPLDAVLGLAVVLVGVLVMVFGFEQVEEDNVLVWSAIGAAVIGFALLPWPRRKPAPLPEESSPDG